MACCRPLTIKNKNTFGGFLPDYYTVPCGYCLNCRVDRRNELEVYCEDLETRFGVGTFLTLTYDDNHIIENDFNDDLGVFSLTKSHLQNFIKRLRSCIKYAGLKSKYIFPDFKYLAVGEYGHDSFRNHFHLLIFGLDYLQCEKLFQKNWLYGDIMSLPIKKGAFRYVLKYLDKQVKGTKAVELYDNYGLERPFCCHSINFGRGFIEDNLDFILSNDYQFLWHNNRLTPISSYYRRMLSGSTGCNYELLAQRMSDYKQPKNDGSIFGYSLKSMNDFNHKMALQREKSLIRQARNDGYAVDDSYLYSPYIEDRFKFNAQSLVDFAIYGDVVPF